MLTKAKLGATSHRWVAALANYNFTLSYRAKQLNADADGLSKQVFTDVKAVCQAAIVSIPLADSVSSKTTTHFGR